MGYAGLVVEPIDHTAEGLFSGFARSIQPAADFTDFLFKLSAQPASHPQMSRTRHILNIYGSANNSWEPGLFRLPTANPNVSSLVDEWRGDPYDGRRQA